MIYLEILDVILGLVNSGPSYVNDQVFLIVVLQ